MEYIAIYTDEYLEHHGVKGQKWGVRKYQNPDGTFNEAGKKRYFGSQKSAEKSAKKFNKKAQKLERKGDVLKGRASKFKNDSKGASIAAGTALGITTAAIGTFVGASAAVVAAPVAMATAAGYVSYKAMYKSAANHIEKKANAKYSEAEEYYRMGREAEKEVSRYKNG